MKSVFRKSALAVLVAGGLASLGGCFPVLIGGAMTTAMVATDRRTSGTVVEDNAIQLKAGSRIGDALGDRGHVNVTSYNRRVLITGEVPSLQDKQLVDQVVRNVENVEGTYNELDVMETSGLSGRSNDILITSRIKAQLIDAHDLVANAFKVVTERGVVYVMGRVTEREARRATEIIRSTDGVLKLVLLWNIISEDELARMLPAQPAISPASEAATTSQH